MPRATPALQGSKPPASTMRAPFLEAASLDLSYVEWVLLTACHARLHRVVSAAVAAVLTTSRSSSSWRASARRDRSAVRARAATSQQIRSGTRSTEAANAAPQTQASQ